MTEINVPPPPPPPFFLSSLLAAAAESDFWKGRRREAVKSHLHSVQKGEDGRGGGRRAKGRFSSYSSFFSLPYGQVKVFHGGSIFSWTESVVIFR